jgi:hypothetical protein
MTVLTLIAFVLLAILGRGVFLLVRPYRTCRRCRPGGLLGGSLPAIAAGVKPVRRRRGRCWRCKGTRQTRRWGAFHVHKVKLSLLQAWGREGVGLMSCPGLHCPGCSGGQSLGILAGVVAVVIIADETVQWVAERIWWIGGTLALCFALAVAASMWLEGWNARREARFAAAHGILSRADVILPAPAATGLPRQQRLAVEPPAAVHIHFHGLPDAEQAAIIRTALSGPTGEAITGGN